MYNFSVLCLFFFFFFFSVIPEGEGAGIIEILAKWISGFWKLVFQLEHGPAWFS